MSPYDRILVTGGSGFIGTNLVEALIADGHSVLNIDIATPRMAGHLECWRNVDILDALRLKRAFVDFRPDLVVHLAARTDLDEKRSLSGYAANVAGTSNIVEAIEQAGSVNRSLFASSRLVCRIGHTPSDDLDYCPTTLYGQSKVEGEKSFERQRNGQAPGCCCASHRSGAYVLGHPTTSTSGGSARAPTHI